MNKSLIKILWSKDISVGQVHTAHSYVPPFRSPLLKGFCIGINILGKNLNKQKLKKIMSKRQNIRTNKIGHAARLHRVHDLKFAGRHKLGRNTSLEEGKRVLFSSS